MFNFKDFIISRGIGFVDSGPNVKKGNFNIDCPFCNLPTSHHSSKHLGIDPNTNFWACWRNKDHRGRKPHRLVMQLIGCNFKQAREIVGDSGGVFKADAFEALASGEVFEEDKQEATSKGNYLHYPREFREFDGKYRIEDRFIDYMMDRGFRRELGNFIDRYSLKYCVSGQFSNRIIMPMTLHGRVVSWTSRAIGKASLRYMHLKAEDSYIPPKEFIYNYDNAMRGGEVLFINEGPVDAQKIDFYSSEEVSAVGLLNMTCEGRQLYWLKRVIGKYNKVVVLLDRGEVRAIDALMGTLSIFRNVMEGEFIETVNDPGELTSQQVKTLTKRYIG